MDERNKDIICIAKQYLVTNSLKFGETGLSVYNYQLTMKGFIFLTLVIFASSVLVPLTLLSNSPPLNPSNYVSPGLSPFVYNFSTSDSQAVLSRLTMQYPEIKDWVPKKGFKMIVGEGLFYEFVLTDQLSNRMVTASAFRKNGITTIVLFEILPLSTLPTLYGSAWNNPIPPAVDGFNSYTNYDNGSFIAALKQSLDLSPKYRLYHLSQTSLLTSKKLFYFRFLFQETPSSTQYIELIECLAKPADPTFQLNSFIFINIKSTSFYSDPYSDALKFFPYFGTDKIMSVRKQVSYLESFEFVFLNSTSPIAKPAVLVSADEAGEYTALIVRNDSSRGYSLEAVEVVRTMASDKWPQLKGFGLTNIENIRTDQTGLKLTFKKNGSTRIVQFDLKGQQQSLVISTP